MTEEFWTNWWRLWHCILFAELYIPRETRLTVFFIPYTFRGKVNSLDWLYTKAGLLHTMYSRMEV